MDTTLNEKVESFFEEHEYMLTTALTSYIDMMRQEAGRALAAYEAIKDDPEQRAAQDKTLMTTNGLKISSLMIRDAADRAENTLQALEQLFEDIESAEEE